MRLFYRVYLCAPLRVDRVAHHSRAFLLAMVGQRGEDAVLAGLDGELQVGVGVEEHPLLQTNCLEVCDEREPEANRAGEDVNMFTVQNGNRISI